MTKIPEWQAVQAVVDASPWTDLDGPLLAHTDGSAPFGNPDGPIGFAAVLTARLRQVDVAGGVPPRLGSSNNRAELAGVLAAVEVARRLKVTLQVWSDSDYVVGCAQGRYKRKRNLDLWEVYDFLAIQVPGLSIGWLRGHAGNRGNERAHRLARAAACRARPSDYTLTLHQQGYRLETRSGKSRIGRAEHPLDAGLASLIQAVERAGRSPKEFTLSVRGDPEPSPLLERFRHVRFDEGEPGRFP